MGLGVNTIYNSEGFITARFHGGDLELNPEDKNISSGIYAFGQNTLLQLGGTDDSYFLLQNFDNGIYLNWNPPSYVVNQNGGSTNVFTYEVPVSNDADDATLTFQINANDTFVIDLNDTTVKNNLIGESNISGSTLAITNTAFSTTYHENFDNIGSTSGNVDIDLSQGNNFYVNRTGGINIDFINPPNGPRAVGFTLVLNDGGSGATVTWNENIEWANGIAPTLTTSGKDILVFYTYDGGTTYYGFLSAANVS